MIPFVEVPVSTRCEVCGQVAKGNTYQVFRKQVSTDGGALVSRDEPVFCCIGKCSQTFTDALDSQRMLAKEISAEELTRLANLELNDE